MNPSLPKITNDAPLSPEAVAMLSAVAREAWGYEPYPQTARLQPDAGSALPTDIMGLIDKAFGFCGNDINNLIITEYRDDRGQLRDALAASIINHIDSLNTGFKSLKESVCVQSLNGFSCDFLISLTLVNKSLLKLCEDAIKIRDIPLNGVDAPDSIYRYANAQPIVEAAARAYEIKGILKEIRRAL